MDNRDGLILSFNTASTSIIPILNGKGILGKSKRYVIYSALSVITMGLADMRHTCPLIPISMICPFALMGLQPPLGWSTSR